ncbi:MAG: DNA replication/repair protein RecF [Lachnospiraceae bacterium]|nr:DNA replication/repair protein RecF [Lachnospiraceae bacterium]
MIIQSLELKDYRNYRSLSIEFNKNINILFGNNAQGKTNILEALYMCATTKSHKGSKDKEMIRFKQDEAHLRLYLQKKEISHKIDMHLKKNKTKGVAIDGISIKKSSELFGLLNIVFFSPEDLSIIKNGPSERRKFMDLELCQLDKIYFYNLSKYNKILVQRNNLLKQIKSNPSLIDTLDIWDEQLVNYGINIIKKREEFIVLLNKIIYQIHQKLTGGLEKIKVEYDPSVKEKEFHKELSKKRELDLKNLYTYVGPHKDDISFYVNGIDIRKFGSQGQQRTAALSLKLAEIELVKKIINDTPILLLDDVLSELDKNRKNYLLDSINDVQTIITCTGLDEFINGRIHVNKIFEVNNGVVRTVNH